MVTVRAIWLLVICCGLLPLVRGQFVWPITKNDHIPLAESVATLARNHFSKATCTVVVLERSWKEKMRDKHSRILEYILKSLQGTMAVQLHTTQSMDQPWQYYIFVVDGVDSFEDIGWRFPKTHFERQFRFFIILTKFTLKFMKTLKQIFSSCYDLHVLHANVILEHPELGICMYKYSWFSKDKCNEVQPYLYFCFKDGVHNLREVFPWKLMNYWGCPLQISARYNPPNFIFHGNRSKFIPGETIHNYGGIEGDLLKLVAITLNFTVRLVSLFDDRESYSNSTTDDCLSQLLEEKADMAVGGFGLMDNMKLLLSPSVVYRHSPLVFIVRKGMPMGSVSRLSWPFNGEVWIILALYLLVGSLALYSLRLTKPEFQNFILGYRNHAPLTNFIAVFLGYPMTKLPVRNFARYLLTVWLLMSLVIRNAYQCSLYDSFRTDRNERIPQDYDDLIKLEYKVFVSRGYVGHSIFPTNRTIVTGHGHILRMKKLEKIQGHYTTVALKDNFISYLKENYRNGSKLVLVKQLAFLHHAVFFFRKHSMYLPSINGKLKLLNYAGITNLMYSNNVRKYVLFKRRHHKGSVTPEAIKFFRLKGIYDICGYMLIFGCVVFVLELLSVRFAKLRDFINWIN